MKKPEEYLNSWMNAYDMNINMDKRAKDAFLDCIKEVQIDAYNEALEDAADNVDYKEVTFKSSNDSFTMTVIDKQSILKLKK